MRNTIEISAPPIEPITTEEAKRWLSVGDGFNTSMDESEIDNLIVAAREGVEDEMQKPIIIREFQTTYDRISNKHLRYFCTDFFMELPKQPIVSIVSVKYFDEDNVEQTVDSSEYYFDSKKIVFKDLTHTTMRAYKSFVINYTAGFSTTQAGVKNDIKTALKYHLADFWKVQQDYMGRNKDTSVVIATENPMTERARAILKQYIDSSFFDDGEGYYVC